MTMYIHGGLNSELLPAMDGKGSLVTSEQACLKIEINGLEISAGFDNSCGAFAHLSRADIRVFRGCGGRDVTREVVGDKNDLLVPNGDSFMRLLNFIKARDWSHLDGGAV